MAEEKEKPTGKVKRPTAKKRDIQSERKRLHNKAFRSKVLSATRSFESSLKQGQADAMKQTLSTLFSLLDKGVKTGIYKINKASRDKARLSKLIKAKA